MKPSKGNEPRDPYVRYRLGLDIKKRRRKPPKGGSESVTVEPNRPKLGEGGAAAALEFDE